MLRIYCRQKWYGLADEALEDALYGSQCINDNSRAFLEGRTMRTSYLPWGLILAMNGALADSAYTPTDGGTIEVLCTCTVAFSGCHTEWVDKLTGNQKQTWYQQQSVKAGKALNLDAACYRKRDLEKHGNGLCCESPDGEEQTIKQLFRGVVKK